MYVYTYPSDMEMLYRLGGETVTCSVFCGDVAVSMCLVCRSASRLQLFIPNDRDHHPGRGSGQNEFLLQTMYMRSGAMHVRIYMYPTFSIAQHVLPPSSRNKAMETGGDPLDIPGLETATRTYLRAQGVVSCPFEKCSLGARPSPGRVFKFCVEIKL